MKEKDIIQEDFISNEELEASIATFIREKLLPEYFPNGVTSKDLGLFKKLFYPKGTYLKKAYKQFSSIEYIPLTLIRRKAMELDLDLLSGNQILQLYEVLSYLERLELNEKLNFYERKELYDKIILLEKAIEEIGK